MTRQHPAFHRPAFVHEAPVPMGDPGLAAALLQVSGLVPAISDQLDMRGLRGAVPSSLASPLLPGTRAVGPAVTLRYLPERFAAGRLRTEQSPGRLGNHAVTAAAREGDVLVIDGCGCDVSLFGGVAGKEASAAGVAAVLVNGAVRDVDELVASGLCVWASSRTPVTGRLRMEAVELNGWVGFCGVQARPGDIVVADDSGICFVPPEFFAEIAQAVLQAPED